MAEHLDQEPQELHLHNLPLPGTNRRARAFLRKPFLLFLEWGVPSKHDTPLARDARFQARRERLLFDSLGSRKCQRPLCARCRRLRICWPRTLLGHRSQGHAKHQNFNAPPRTVRGWPRRGNRSDLSALRPSPVAPSLIGPAGPGPYLKFSPKRRKPG